tara:strand:+ start:567 stop:1184 length:618 start_codon:yes stop_codon:yes gene_type:complete
MWFSIIKNKLLIKPKTQLRVQDNPIIDDDEPCKKKLKEYTEYMEFMKNNYKASEDKKLLKLLVGVGDITFRKGKGLSLLSYAEWNEGQISQNYVNVVVPEQFEKIPEKVACKALDMLESNNWNNLVDIDKYKITHAWSYDIFDNDFYANNIIRIYYDGWGSDPILIIGKLIYFQPLNNSKSVLAKFNRADLIDFMDIVKAENWRN